MKVFKFGGASVKNAEGVRNVLKVLEKTGKSNNLLVVVSAMGKTTNALEEVVEAYLKNGNFREKLGAIKKFHQEIIAGLFAEADTAVLQKTESFLNTLENFLEHNKSSKYDFVYDQVVSYGELISTTIVSEFLEHSGFPNKWLDVRHLIKTDATYRDAQINWRDTQFEIRKHTRTNLLNITQGFIGSDPNNFTTTLGREGSDYTAAIFAYCLDAESVTIWKDVPGVLNGDPSIFQNTRLLEQISYEEAIELAFYGASVIHPKTLQPLQGKEIPLYVKSFLDPEGSGTAVRKGLHLSPRIPCFIVKKNQVLISLSSLDFSFMLEENISEIFRLFHLYQIKVDLIQNSAISFSVCVDNRFNNLEKLIQHLKARFKVSYTKKVSLYTIRHFDEAAIKLLEKGKEVLLKQLTHNTMQMVTKENI
ncbi:aspartate kinase [Autumnicola musiva]|uniref:Aspartokinase n=1 Tax=Autumnicola musiva TaxID=3075589 RepID=A0ABU3D878_9FLAO|nr:aspartate kinase [Zunongwangia sp. F117]MDT0677722.1 aspartate kinase [Zunongwangia sp. F117]